MTQAASLQEISTAYAADLEDVNLLIINSAGYEEGVPDMVEGITLPVLQDTTEAAAATAYGASKWYVYFLDRKGYPRYIQYEMDLDDDDRARFLSDIATLVAEDGS